MNLRMKYLIEEALLLPQMKIVLHLEQIENFFETKIEKIQQLLKEEQKRGFQEGSPTSFIFYSQTIPLRSNHQTINIKQLASETKIEATVNGYY